MIIKDIYPAKAQFKVGEKISINVELEGKFESEILKCKVYRLHEEVRILEISLSSKQENVTFEFDVDNQEKLISGYGVEVELYHEGQVLQKLSTAFDILPSWKYAPRYGFLADFSKTDLDDKEDLKEMNKFHLNIVQYYDWMYRHHDLIPKSDIFIDPLQRELSLSTVKDKIDLSHKYGMEAIAYGAVYASAPEYYKKNKDLGIYKNNGDIYGFGDFLYMMDISRENKWHDHIINEFHKVIKLGFDGIHMDQYGFPKEAISSANGKRAVRNLREDFPNLINDTRNYIEESGEKVSLIFNAVNNWPVETVAKSEEDAVYIEVWPPNDTYQDLYNLITNAKKYAPEKQVILAAYMKPFLEELNIPVEQAENATLLTMATIFASGGFHLLLGENRGILDDPYYPKYRTIENEEFNKKLRNYYDFMVKYEELLFDFDLIDTSMINTGGINTEYVVRGVQASPKAEADKVWSLIKEKAQFKVINLVNFKEIQDMNWNEPKVKLPSKVENIEMSVLTCNDVKGIYLASPDFEDGKAVRLNFNYAEGDQGNEIRFVVPKLEIWDLIYIVY
ncbi:glycoside hydrolase family 66 protein [Inconstantimicrobium mannanitabidum]|uniref:Cycloisomaltooligosaccharide glucanotransferase n=1 Tax=Inconstantimicrobium mannanitabidum TaxID=1604901 RepID=A0ACB5RED6_9CLOT|nr:glycoside hydrolase family 66 protein [Clostridium sp. TW13]GKX67643.1 cycloisomaltooligosaccharide glucanotransferase [Clostridium sp. TW13]